MNSQINLVFSIFLFCSVYGNVQQKFEENEIVPDVLANPPNDILSVTYISEIIKEKVDLGNELKPKNTVKFPLVTINKSNETKFTTLLMVDPDAPSRKNPIKREFCHWLVGNIKNDDFTQATVLKDYFRPAPPKNTGFHRYIFLLFEQPEYIDFINEPRVNSTCRTSRPNFSTKKFVKEYNLGEKYKGNFFVASWDESVPTSSSGECLS